MANFDELMKTYKPTPSEPLDTRGRFDRALKSYKPVGGTPPTMDEEVVEDVTARPVGRPEEPEAPTAQDMPSMYPEVNEVQQKAAEAADKLQLNPYVTGASFGTAIENVQQQSKEVTEKTMSAEGTAAAREFIKEDALPVVGATVGTLMAPATGGTSLLMSMGLTAGAAGVGGAIGEGVEQTLKMEGYMPTAQDETRPRDAWDVLERSAVRGGEEAAWALVPDMLFRGVPAATRKLLLTGAKPAVDVTGKTVDVGRQSLINIMSKHAAKTGGETGDFLLSSDVVNSGLLNAAENVASNSYLTGRVPQVRKVQAEAIMGEVKETVEQFTKPAEGYVKENVDGAISAYVGANFDSMNDFAVAGLVNIGFKKAQEAQKSVARSMYRTIDDLMNVTEMKTVYKEVELPLMGADGRPLTTMQVVQQEAPAFPVYLDKVRAIGEERMDILGRTGAKIDAQTAELLNLPAESDFKAVGERLIDMKADSRTLGKSGAEGAAKQKLVLDRAIKEIEAAMDDAALRAEQAGITAPDGRSVYELKKDADAIWKEQVEDFQNSYLMNIIKKTHPKNGAPEKLGKLFIQNDTAARNIVKILDDAKGMLKGEELEQVLQAENAIKGSIVEEIFMPFDDVSGKYVAPDVSVLTKNEAQLKRIFGDDTYKELRNLGAAIEQQSGMGTSNYLGFAQRARESGMMMSTVKAVFDTNTPIVRRLVKELGATGLFALGAGKILTSPRMIRQVLLLNDPKVDMAIKTQIFQSLVHRTYEYQQAIEAGLTPEDRERMEAALEDRKEAERMRKGM